MFSLATRAGSCPSPDQWTMMDLLDDGCKSDDDCSGPDDKCCFNGLGYQCVPPDGMLTSEYLKSDRCYYDHGCCFSEIFTVLW